MLRQNDHSDRVETMTHLEGCLASELRTKSIPIEIKEEVIPSIQTKIYSCMQFKESPKNEESYSNDGSLSGILRHLTINVSIGRSQIKSMCFQMPSFICEREKRIHLFLSCQGINPVDLDRKAMSGLSTPNSDENRSNSLSS